MSIQPMHFTRICRIQGQSIKCIYIKYDPRVLRIFTYTSVLRAFGNPLADEFVTVRKKLYLPRWSLLLGFYVDLS